MFLKSSVLALALGLGTGPALRALPTVYLLQNDSDSSWVLTDPTQDGPGADPGFNLEVEPAQAFREDKESRRGSGPARWLIAPNSTVIFRVEAAAPHGSPGFTLEELGEGGSPAPLFLNLAPLPVTHRDGPGGSPARPAATYLLSAEGGLRTLPSPEAPGPEPKVPLASTLPRAKRDRAPLAPEAAPVPDTDDRGAKRPRHPSAPKPVMGPPKPRTCVFPCREPGCGRMFGSSGWLIRHCRSAHGLAPALRPKPRPKPVRHGVSPGASRAAKLPPVFRLPPPALVAPEPLVTREADGRFRLNPTPALIRAMRQNIEAIPATPYFPWCWASGPEAPALGDLIGVQTQLFRVGERIDAQGLAILEPTVRIGSGPMVPLDHEARLVVEPASGAYRVLRPAASSEPPRFATREGRLYVEETRLATGGGAVAPAQTGQTVPVVPPDENSLAAAIFFLRTGAPPDRHRLSLIRASLAARLSDEHLAAWVKELVEEGLNHGGCRLSGDQMHLQQLGNSRQVMTLLRRDDAFQRAFRQVLASARPVAPDEDKLPDLAPETRP